MKYYHVPSLIKKLIERGDFHLNTEIDRDDFHMITEEALRKLEAECQTEFAGQWFWSNSEEV